MKCTWLIANCRSKVDKNAASVKKLHTWTGQHVFVQDQTKNFVRQKRVFFGPTKRMYRTGEQREIRACEAISGVWFMSSLPITVHDLKKLLARADCWTAVLPNFTVLPQRTVPRHGVFGEEGTFGFFTWSEMPTKNAGPECGFEPVERFSKRANSWRVDLLKCNQRPFHLHQEQITNDKSLSS